MSYELDRNLTSIRRIEHTIHTIKHLEYKGKLPQNVYHQLRHYLAIEVNALHNERVHLKSELNERKKRAYQLKLEKANKESKFRDEKLSQLLTKLSSEEIDFLKSNVYKL